MKNLFENITKQILKSLKDGVLPWTRPWDSSMGMHRNALTNRPYRGINLLLLNLRALEKNYNSPLWLTFRDAQKKGGHVRKGEKGIRIVFWKFKEVPVLDSHGNQVLDEDGTPRSKISVFGCSYVVFNLEQCEGLEHKEMEEPDKQDQLEDAECILDLASISYGGSEPLYSPALDRIRLPIRNSFKTMEDFYATAFHEMIHWTGHKSRLNRNFSSRFGDKAYAFEELIAEMGAAFLGAYLGLPIERLQHPEYMADWIRVLERDKSFKAVFTAAGRAQKACDFLIEKAGINSIRDEIKEAA